MQKHLSEHVRDLMRKARENPNFHFAALPVVSKAKKVAPLSRESRVSPTRKPKDKLKVKLQPKQKSPSKAKGRTMKKEAESPRAKAAGRSAKTKDELSIKREPSLTKKRNANALVEEQLVMDQVETSAEEVTVKEKWLKLYRDKYRAVDEARFRAIQVVIILQFFLLSRISLFLNNYFFLTSFYSFEVFKICLPFFLKEKSRFFLIFKYFSTDFFVFYILLYCIH